jgi:catechol 2,3-dioxygenase
VDRSIRFYESHLGFAVLRRNDAEAWLGVPGASPDDALLVLAGSPAAPHVSGTTGLYHFAILVPSRAHLATALRRLADTHTRLQGAADHGVSEAIYLADPDGNGIEIYRDRPRDQWPIVDGGLHMGVDPLDLERLLDEGGDGASAALATGTRIGHVHLHVSDLTAARQFYAEVLGFAVMQRYGPSALFVSAGGYHHHIGLNTWAGVGAPPPPPGAIGLRHFTIRLPNAAALEQVGARLREAAIPVHAVGEAILTKDPSSNAILLAIKA